MSAVSRLSSPQFWFVLVLFAFLMAAAHVGAEWFAYRDAERAATLATRPAEEWKHQQGDFPTPHSALHYRIAYTAWAATLLVTVALGFYILRRPGPPANYWVQFWTFAFLAYLAHLYWSVGVSFSWNFAAILRSPLNVSLDPEKVVGSPVVGLLLAVWWGIDVILAWALPDPLQAGRWLRIERGAVSLFAFVVFVAATLLAAQAAPFARVLGVVLVVAVLSAYGLRIALRTMEPGSFGATLFVGSFRLLNLFVPWHRLPTFLAAFNLAAVREVLRAENLHSTTGVPVTNPDGLSASLPLKAEYLGAREVDGNFNDLHDPDMGSASVCDEAPGTLPGEIVKSKPGARFGRNVPLAFTQPDAPEKLLDPSPREISRRLLARTTFHEAGILNYLAAAWIQFEVHDWFFHGNPVKDDPFRIPLTKDDNWDPATGEMHIRRTRSDPTRKPNDGQGPPTYVNAESHWWDGSQVYGSDPDTARRLRINPDTAQVEPNGRLYVKDGLLPIDRSTGLDMSGFTGNWWIGLTLLHTLFTLEHNAVCDHLQRTYPKWDGDRLYNTARLVVAALMAKIHTVEWTTAILPNPALQIGMNANWWGLLSANVRKAFGRVSENESFSGIPGSETNHHTAPYALTEEFVAVYRMHPLMRDAIDLYRAADGSFVGNAVLEALLRDGARRHVTPLPPGDTDPAPQALGSVADWFYSFGNCSPGSLTLRNYPNYLRNFVRVPGIDDDRIDLAAVDVLRDRERGVPRYNQFRKLFHMPPIRTFDALTADPALAAELKDVYKGDIDRVDLMVGLYAEAPPEGFGFSDTAFRVFVLMASRRLKSDRFLTTDFTTEVYSQAGMDWITSNGMASILLRHYPELAPALRGVKNPFARWKTVAESAKYQPYEFREGMV